MNKSLALVLGFGLFFLLLIGFSVYNHEQVHKVIFEYDGCGNSVVHYGLGESYTTCVSEDYQESDVAALSHNFNEVMGYNVMTIVLLGLVLVMSIVLTSKEE